MSELRYIERGSIEYKYIVPKPNRYDKLMYHSIIGIIDSYDAVHSEDFHFSEYPTHQWLYPTQTFKRWRWSFDDGITCLSDDLNAEDYDRIINHIETVYNIKFNDNGFHDVQDFISKMSYK